MGSTLYRDYAIKIWGEIEIDKFEKLNKELAYWEENSIYRQKINIARENLSTILFPSLVKFVGISGSIAARTVKTEDDIDLFIVVKNDSAWFYRLFVWLKNLFNPRSIVRREGFRFGKDLKVNDQKDEFCLNFIIEERALSQLEDSIFVFHELTSLIPIYNNEYIENIYSANSWLFTEWSIQKPERPNVKADYKRYHFLAIFNFIAFSGQLVFQLLHKPDFKRLFNNYKKGIIAFFPKEFKGYKSKL